MEQETERENSVEPLVPTPPKSGRRDDTSEVGSGKAAQPEAMEVENLDDDGAP